MKYIIILFFAICTFNLIGQSNFLSDTIKLKAYIEKSINVIMHDSSLNNGREHVFSFIEGTNIIKTRKQAVHTLGEPTHIHYFQDSVYCFMYAITAIEAGLFDDFFCLIFDGQDNFESNFMYFSEASTYNFNFWIYRKKRISYYNDEASQIPPNFSNKKKWRN